MKRLIVKIAGFLAMTAGSLLLLVGPETLALSADAATTGHQKRTTQKPPSPLELTFSGELTRLDLSRHPMTLTLVLGRTEPLHFIFDGLLIPDTMVLSDGKTVGVTALKPGQFLTIRYRITPKGPQIQKIVLDSGKKNHKKPALPKQHT